MLKFISTSISGPKAPLIVMDNEYSAMDKHDKMQKIIWFGENNSEQFTLKRQNDTLTSNSELPDICHCFVGSFWILGYFECQSQAEDFSFHPLDNPLL